MFLGTEGYGRAVPEGTAAKVMRRAGFAIFIHGIAPDVVTQLVSPQAATESQNPRLMGLAEISGDHPVPG